jgi:hypothetical protein
MITLLGALAIAASLRGVVVDVTGGSIRNAAVRVLNGESHAVVASATSDDQGSFLIDGVEPGTYAVAASAAGFRLRVLDGVEIHDADWGKIQLEVQPCDAPAVSCFTVLAAGASVPDEPKILRQGGLLVPQNCGADLLEAKAPCPPGKQADLTVQQDGAKMFVLPLNAATLDLRCNGQPGPRIRIDGLAGLDFCVHRGDGLESHVYVSWMSSIEVRLWITTTRRQR